MPFSIPAMIALAAACAPDVAPRTLLAVAQVESGFDPLAIGLEGGARGLRPADLEAAVGQASALIAAGRNIDLGLAQINSRNLGWLGLTPRTAFDPCRNLEAGARVLKAGYRRAAPTPGREQPALRVALSYYNTGHPQGGLRNGYVAKVSAAAARLDLAPAPIAPPETPPTPAWDVFAQARADRAAVLVFAAHPGAQP
ncbi:MAG: lytic transglycosylase domain-containing protein [Phenylobacterium sp.]